MNALYYMKSSRNSLLLLLSIALIATVESTFSSDTPVVESQMEVDEKEVYIQDVVDDVEELKPGMEREYAGIVFCWIPPGSFLMGSPEDEQAHRSFESPQREVIITEGFWMSKYALTQAQWQAVMGSNPSLFRSKNRPVEQLSWDDIRGAGGYLEKLNAANPGYNFRLPSEAEWEYAYRAETTTRFYWGDDPDYTLIDEYAWYSGNNALYGSKEVGLKLPNAWGLHDMAGNVWEWCEDDWHSSYHDAPNDGSAWVNEPRGRSRLVRGGSASSTAKHCRAANRGLNFAGLLNGFRIVCTLD